MFKISREIFLLSENSAQTYPELSPARIYFAPPRKPVINSRARIMLDFPAPLSPVMTLRPELKFISASLIPPIFFITSFLSIKI